MPILCSRLCLVAQTCKYGLGGAGQVIGASSYFSDEPLLVAADWVRWTFAPASARRSCQCPNLYARTQARSIESQGLLTQGERKRWRGIGRGSERKRGEGGREGGTGERERERERERESER